MRRLQVAYLADSLYQSMTAGIARYTVELARELGRMPEIELRLMTLIPPDTVADLAEKRDYPLAESIPSKVPRKLQYLLWHLGKMPGALRESTLDADVIHTPTFLVPPRKKLPLVVTVHDLTLLRFPHQHPRNTRILMGSGLRRAVHDADGFITVSEYTKQDLIRLTGVSPDRVFVTYEAADSRFIPMRDNGVLARHEIKSPYILYVGTLEPRKNIMVLLQAFAALENKALILVLAGAKGWMYDNLFTAIKELGIQDRIKVPGYVADEDLPALYSQAQVFVYPSLFEGFGLPVLEAMQCGVPVITTNVSSLPEVAGTAAILFTPDDVTELTTALKRVLSEAGLREEMKGKSLEQAARFSWQHTAELTAEVYQRVVR